MWGSITIKLLYLAMCLLYLLIGTQVGHSYPDAYLILLGTLLTFMAGIKIIDRRFPEA